MEWCASGIYSLRNQTNTNAGDNFGNYTGYLCLFVAFSLVPGILIGLFMQPAKMLYKKNFNKRWGYVFLELKKRTSLHSSYFGFYVLRRLQFFWIVFDMSPWPGIQIVLMLFQCLAFHLYVGSRPLTSKWLMCLYVLEETVILAAVLHLCVFSLWGSPTYDALIGWGWSLIIVISLHFLVVCIYIIFVFIDYLRLVFFKWQAIWRVYCVNAFGFRIGKSYKDKFNVKVTERKVE